MKASFTFLLVFLSFLTMAAPPTVPSSTLVFNAIDGAYFNLGWTAGNGARRIIVAKAGGAPTFVPQNGIDYNADNVFGQGQEVAAGEFIIFDHFSSSFFLTGLTPATQYFFRVFEYNGSGTTTEYLTASFLSGSGSTSATPTLQTSNAVFSNVTTNSVTVSWTMGNGQRRLIVVREGAAVNADPVNNEPYFGASAEFGSGATTGPGNFVVYRSSSDATSITNLKAGTEYFFAFYEFNGNQQPQYLKPAYTASVSTRSVPTVASSGLSITRADGKELILGWTSGNGQRRIVIAKQGSEVTSVPVNGTDYTANAVFGQGQQLGAGEFVVYDDNASSTTVSGLNPTTTYFFRVFEYDGTGTGTAYLTSSFASVSGTTASRPTVQSQFLPATNVTATSLRLNFTPGNGRARLIIGRSGSAVNVAPVDFTTYTDNTIFGTGQDLGNGNFVLGFTTASLLGIQNLQPNTTYHFAIFELNGFGQPLYLTPAATGSATTSATLPVKLAGWTATPDENKVVLQWKTSMEVNASHFVIERSADGSQFQPLTIVKAAGNSSADVSYREEDKMPLAGTSYYRLKMVDQDGKWEYAPIRPVSLTGNTTVRILANPVRNNLQVQSSTDFKREWTIVNIAGQVLARGWLLQGKTDIATSFLLQGQYWLRVNEPAKPTAYPFIKQ